MTEEGSDDIDALISTVLALPEEVSRPCTVPLSGVGFTHGRLIHTNEFFVEGKGVLSHTQAAEYLKTLKTNNQALQQNSIKDNNSIQSRPTVPVRDTSQIDVEEDLSDEYFNSSSIVEITEELDANNNIISHDVRDVNKELAKMQRALEMSRQRKQEEGEDIDDERLNHLFQLLKQKEGIDTKQSVLDTIEENPELRFVRAIEESARKSRKSALSDVASIDLGFLDNLEDDENALISTPQVSKAPVPMKSKPKEASKSAGGWTKGFLSSKDNSSSNTTRVSKIESSAKEVPTPRIGELNPSTTTSSSVVAETIIERQTTAPPPIKAGGKRFMPKKPVE